MRGIEQQLLALQKGFTELIPSQLLRPFDERELELVIGGLGSIDINDWCSNTRLKVWHSAVSDSIPILWL
jgi:E3 ubiquitin ligase SMURF1/2